MLAIITGVAGYTATRSDATNGFLTAIESLSLTTPVEVFLTLTALSFLPILLISLTTFTRNIIVLSFLRQSLGLQQSPPNIVLISLAVFITFFTMSPVFEKSYINGVEPYINKEISIDTALDRSWVPFRDFMLRQTREADLALVHELAKEPIPERAEDVNPTYLVPSFLLSELKTAFQIGFVIFLPFLLIDIVIASILMSLGMIMVPPVTIALPIKIMLFVVVDGWSLITKALIISVGT